MYSQGKLPFKSPRKRLHSQEGKIYKDCTRVRVYVRARPLTDDDDEQVLRGPLEFPTNKEIRLVEQKQETTYRFDRVFSPEASNAEVCKAVSEPLINTVVDGYNGSFMVYGQTGTGKTYTVLSDDGLIPQTISQLFQRTFKDQEFTYKVFLSYLQIYKDKIHDLLDPSKDTELHLREHPQEGVIVDGLKEFEIPNPTEAEKLLEYGRKNLVMAETKMVRLSSRSHSLCVIKVEKCKKGSISAEVKSDESNEESLEIARQILESEDKLWRGKLYLCDLAGSERLKKTGAAGNRFEEARYINSSLLELGNVIHALADSRHAHVPFRNSTLTRLLKESLGGNSKASLMICVSSSTKDINETKCSLNFGQRAMRVTKFSSPNVEIDYKALAEYLTKKLRELESAYNVEKENYKKLKVELAQSRKRPSRIPVLRSRLPVPEEPEDTVQSELAPLIQLAKSQLEFVKEEENLYLSRLQLIEQSTNTDEIFHRTPTETATGGTQTSNSVSNGFDKIIQPDRDSFRRIDHAPIQITDSDYDIDSDYSTALNSTNLNECHDLSVSEDQYSASFWEDYTLLTNQIAATEKELNLLRSSNDCAQSSDFDFLPCNDFEDGPVETSESHTSVGSHVLSSAMGNSNGRSEQEKEVEERGEHNGVKLRRKSEELTDVASKRKSANRMSAFLEIVKLRDGGEGAKFREVDLRYHSEGDNASLSSAASSPRNSYGPIYRNSFYEIQTPTGSSRNLSNVQEEDQCITGDHKIIPDSSKVILRKKRGKNLSKLFRRHSFDESKFKIRKKDKRYSAVIGSDLTEEYSSKVKDNQLTLQKRTRSAMFEEHEKNKEIVLAALKDLERDEVSENLEKSPAITNDRSTLTSGFDIKMDSLEKSVENVNRLSSNDITRTSAEPINHESFTNGTETVHGETKRTSLVETTGARPCSSLLVDDNSQEMEKQFKLQEISQVNDDVILRKKDIKYGTKTTAPLTVTPLSSIVMDTAEGSVEVSAGNSSSSRGGNRLYIRHRGRESFVFETEMSAMDLGFNNKPTDSKPADTERGLSARESYPNSAATQDCYDNGSAVTVSRQGENINMGDSNASHFREVEEYEIETTENKPLKDDPYAVLHSTLEMIEPPKSFSSDSSDLVHSISQDRLSLSPDETHSAMLGHTGFENVVDMVFPEADGGQDGNDKERSTDEFGMKPEGTRSEDYNPSTKLSKHDLKADLQFSDQIGVEQKKERDGVEKYKVGDTTSLILYNFDAVDGCKIDQCQFIEQQAIGETSKVSPTVSVTKEPFSNALEQNGENMFSETDTLIDCKEQKNTEIAPDSLQVLNKDVSTVVDSTTYRQTNEISDKEVVHRQQRASSNGRNISTKLTSNEEDRIKKQSKEQRDAEASSDRNSREIHSGIWDSFDMDMVNVDKISVRDSVILPEDEIITSSYAQQASFPQTTNGDVELRNKDQSSKTKDSKESKRRSLVMKAILIDEVMEKAETYDADHLERITDKICTLDDEVFLKEQVTTPSKGPSIMYSEHPIEDVQTVVNIEDSQVFRESEHQEPIAVTADAGFSFDYFDDSLQDSDLPYECGTVGDENRNYLRRAGSAQSSISTDTELELVHAMEESNKLRASLTNVKRQYDDILKQFDSLLGCKNTAEKDLEHTKKYLAETMKCKTELEEELAKAREQLALVTAAHEEEAEDDYKSDSSEQLCISPIKQESDNDEEANSSESDEGKNKEFLSQTTLTNVTPIDGNSPINDGPMSPDVYSTGFDFRVDQSPRESKICESFDRTDSIVSEKEVMSEQVTLERSELELKEASPLVLQSDSISNATIVVADNGDVSDFDVISAKAKERSVPEERQKDNLIAPVAATVLLQDKEKVAALIEPKVLTSASQTTETTPTVPKQTTSKMPEDVETFHSATDQKELVRKVSASTQDNLDKLEMARQSQKKDFSTDTDKVERKVSMSRKKNRSRPASKIIEEADPKEFRWISKKGLVTSEEKIKRNEQLTLAAIQNAELKKELLLTKLEKIRLEAVLSCVMMRTPSSEVSREYKKLSINSITSSKSTLRSSTSATDLTFSGGSEATSPFHSSSRRTSNTQRPRTYLQSDSSTTSPAFAGYDPKTRQSQMESQVISPTSSLFEHSSILTDSSFSPMTGGDSSPSMSSVVTTSMPLSERTAPCGQDRDDQSVTKPKHRSSADRVTDKSVLSEDTADVTSGDSRQDISDEDKKEKSLVGCLPFLKRRSHRKKSKKSKTAQSPAHSSG